MATVIASGLTAKVKYSQVQSAGPNGRKKLLTEVDVMCGPIVVANKTIQGRFSQQQALAEFKRLPKGWTIYNEDAARLPIAA